MEKIKDKSVKEILRQREIARKEKDWSKSDALRDQLAKMGYKVVDKEDGQYVVKE